MSLSPSAVAEKVISGAPLPVDVEVIVSINGETCGYSVLYGGQRVHSDYTDYSFIPV